jgi:hypothetical protein
MPTHGPKPPRDRDAVPMSRGAPTWVPTHAHDDPADDLAQYLAWAFFAMFTCLAVYLAVK